MDAAKKMSIAKKAAIVTVLEYMNKIAIANQEEALSFEEMSEVSARADKMIPDETVATADSPTLVSKIIESVSQAAAEIEESSALAAAGAPALKVKPEDMGIVPIGAGSILKEVLQNPHANTGGVLMSPEINITQSNLLTGGEKDRVIEKLSTLGWEEVVNLAKTANSEQDIINSLQGENVMNSRQLEQVSIKLASLAGELLKIATGDATIVTGQGVASKILDNATAAPMQNNTAAGTVESTGATEEVNAAAIAKATEEKNLMKDTTPAETVADAGIKDNPAHKVSAVTDLRSLIAKHRSKK